MNGRLAVGRLLAGLAVVVLVGGCASGTSSTAAPASSSPAGTSLAAVATPAPTTTATTAPTPAPTPSVVVTADVAYESANPLLLPGVLDVYAPAKAGPWPVVVMLHGGRGDKGALLEHARKVADLGFVVFVPTWGAGGVGSNGLPSYDQLVAGRSQSACAIAFARTHAAEYGGDPAKLIVFGHSAGANMGAAVAFARPEPTTGCLGGTKVGAIDALVTWEGDWTAMDPRVGWDDAIAADPRLIEAYSPLSYVANDKDLKVVMLVSEHPGIERQVPDQTAIDAFLTVRDPSGDLRMQVDASGAFTDGVFDAVELQQLLFSILKAQGNPVSLDVMPGSTHVSLSDEGWKVFLAAFGKAAGGA